MKLKFTLILFLFVPLALYSQQGINYKAVVKDNSGNVIANTSINVQFSILQGDPETSVYSETHSPTTDDNGMIILNIGEGSPLTGEFSAIDWASASSFLNVQIDTGSGLTDMGTTEFKSVPYAITAANVQWETTENDHIENKNTGNVGIGQSSPEQKLHVNGKLKIGDDEQTPSEGTVRYNSSAGNFEGYDGSEWVSMSYKPKVYTFEQHPVDQSYSSTSRDVLETFPYSLTIEEPGTYMCFFDITFFDLFGNTTSLTSDRSVYMEFQIYNRLEFRSIGANIVGLPNGFTYYFRQYENVQLHRIMEIPTANQTMEFRFRVNSNGCCDPSTKTYSVRDVKMTAIKLD